MNSSTLDSVHDQIWPTGVMPEWGREGRRIGRYVLGPVLGRGGMGEVFEAWDLILARPLALKLLTLSSPGALARFMQEAKLQARVAHPNICRVLDAGGEDDLPYIAMQLVVGPSLNAAGLSTPEIADLMQKVASAIHAAHRLGLIHRDLKPSNILIERNEQGGWTPYVCDFGLAKDMEAEALTQTQMPMGTPAFMAPEQQYPSSAPVGPAADVYGLGATLCALLTGRPPSNCTPQAPWTRSGPFGWAPPTPSGDLPEAMRHIMRRCLAWHADERYPTAAALAEDLRRFLDGEALQSVQIPPWGRLVRFARRRPIAVVLAGVFLATGLGAGGMFLAARRASLKQAEAAATFAGLIKDLQYDMRVERMMPSHDLRPAFTRVRARMETIRHRMAKGSAETQGPGHFALGWGHLLLHDPQSALREFWEARARGTNTSDLAHAEVRACCEAYLDELPLARQDGREALAVLKRKYLKPAAERLAWIGLDSLEPKALAEAQLELVLRHPERALSLVEKLLAESPGTYEARFIQASAYGQMGFFKQLQGDYTTAKAHYAMCDQALRAAQTFARSDEAALKVELNRRLAWVAVQSDAGSPPLEAYREIEATADRLLALNPTWLPAIADRLTVIWRRADFDLASGRNPRAEVEKGLAILAAADKLPGAAARLHRDRLNLCRVLAAIQISMGEDPTPILLRGLQSGRQDEFTADLRWVYAQWLAANGRDPNPQLDLALQNLERPSFQDFDEYGLAGRKTQVWRAKAAWALENGGNALGAAIRSLQWAEGERKANPSSMETWIDLALARDLVFRARRRTGVSAPSLLHQALREARRACALESDNLQSQECLATVMVSLAEAAQDPDARSQWKAQAAFSIRRAMGISGWSTQPLRKRLAKLTEE